MSKPASAHMGGVKRILRYLHGRPDVHITYSRNSNFELIGFCGVSYGTGNPEKARSTSGSTYFGSEGVIHFSTGIQTIAAQLTNEAELIVTSSYAKQEIYLCGILRELGCRAFRSTRIFCDNKEVLFLAGKGSHSSRSKHLAIRFMGLRDWVIDARVD